MMTIYALADPETQRVYYVGRTQNKRIRKRSYRVSHYRANDALSDWLKALRGKGLQARFIVLEDNISYLNGSLQEHFWIQLFHASGAPLLNRNMLQDIYNFI